MILDKRFKDSYSAAHTTLNDADEFIEMPQKMYDYRYGKDSKGEHELLDRSSIILGMLDDYIIDHPSLVRDRELWELARRIEADLAEFYGRIGEMI